MLLPTMKTAIAPKRHFPVLDWLRACAALSVFAHHFYQQYAQQFTSPYAQAGLSHMGAWGVTVFFVLSGFCIHWSKLSNGPSAPSEVKRINGINGINGIKDYAMRRIFRIYPAFVLCVVLSYGLGTIQNSHLLPPSSALSIFAHLTLLSHFSVEHRVAINNVLWSVVVECYFYMLYGLMMRWFDGIRKVALMTLLAIVLAACTYVASVMLWPSGPERVMVQKLFLTSWWTWCLGAMVAELVHRRTMPLRAPGFNRLCIMTLLVLSLAIGLLPGGLMLQAQRFALPLLAAALLYTLLQDEVPVGHVPLMIWLGTISYSLYLFHPLAIWLGQLFSLPLPATAVLTIGTALVLAYMSYTWVEVPFQAMGKTWSPRPAIPSAARGAM